MSRLLHAVVCVARRTVGTAGCLLLVAASAAQAQPMVTVNGYDGTPLPMSQTPEISRDGRTLLFYTTGRLVDPALPDEEYLVVRRVDTGTVLFARPSPATPALQARLSPDGNHVVYRVGVSTGLAIVSRQLDTGVERPVYATVGRPVIDIVDVSDNASHVVIRETDLEPATRVLVRHGDSSVWLTAPCPATGVEAQADVDDNSMVSADGSTVAYRSLTGRSRLSRLYASALARTTDGESECLRLDDPRVSVPGVLSLRGLDRTGAIVAGDLVLQSGGFSRPFVLERESGRLQILGGSLLTSRTVALSEDGRIVLLEGRRASGHAEVFVVDRLTGLMTEVSAGVGGIVRAGARLSGDGRTVLFRAGGTGLGVPAYLVTLDADGDGMHDAWEILFGLDPADPTDASGDLDGDGVTNLQAFHAGTHPAGQPVRYFAEGASSAFFATSLALFNTSDVPVIANVRFLGPDGGSASVPVTLAAHTPAYVDPDTSGVPFTEFSMIVESPVPLVAERRMTWDRATGYGSHADSGVTAPATTWHFAEGATIAGLQTFFLLQNPTATAATVTMRYLLAGGAQAERTHIVPAQSRLTVWANQEGAPLDAAEFATSVTSDVPIVAERAMYRDAPGEMFSAGAVASGVSTPSPTWFFAEGATGPFFDTYLLLSNPGDEDATVDVAFIRAPDPGNVDTALPLVRRYALPARSRHTVWVSQEDPALRDVQVGMRVEANGPIVAERTMWWPGSIAALWRENHVNTGISEGGRRWAVADIQVDALGDGWDTFLLVTSTEPYLANLRVTVSCADGTVVTRDRGPFFNRTTLWLRHEFPETVGRRCAATVESLPTRITLSPSVPLYRTPLAVEKATYRGDFSAGSVSVGTRLPDPPN